MINDEAQFFWQLSIGFAWSTSIFKRHDRSRDARQPSRRLAGAWTFLHREV